MSIELELELEKKGKLELLKEVRKISDMMNIYYILQKEPKGLGHAINFAKSFIGNEPFAVLLRDDIVDAEKPCLKQMIETYDKYKTTILGIQEVPKKDVCKYGIVDGNLIDDRIHKVNDLVEKPAVENAQSNISILGRYIINPAVFEMLYNTKLGSGGELQLTDALNELSQKEAMYAYNFEVRRYDADDK